MIVRLQLLPQRQVVRLEHRPADPFLDRLLEEEEQAADVDVLPVRVAPTVVRAPQTIGRAARPEDADHVDALQVELALLDVAHRALDAERAVHDLVGRRLVHAARLVAARDRRRTRDRTAAPGRNRPPGRPARAATGSRAPRSRAWSRAPRAAPRSLSAPNRSSPGCGVEHGEAVGQQLAVRDDRLLHGHRVHVRRLAPTRSGIATRFTSSIPRSVSSASQVVLARQRRQVLGRAARQRGRTARERAGCRAPSPAAEARPARA